MEKPFGRDLASARELNAALHEHYPEEAIYRIDLLDDQVPLETYRQGSWGPDSADALVPGGWHLP